MAEERPAGAPATRSDRIEGDADSVGAGPGLGPLSTSVDAATAAAIQQGIESVSSARPADDAAARAPTIGASDDHAAVNTHMEPLAASAGRNLPVGASPIGASDASGIDLRDVAAGWKVYDNDQKAIGEVEAATPRFLRLRQGWIFTHRLFIPDTLVGSIDAEHQRVFLTQTKQTIEGMDLSTPPRDSDGADRSTTLRRELPDANESGVPYTQDSHSRDEVDGPTRQPSVAPDYTPIRNQPLGYAPFRSPQEHDETTTDLRENVAPGGDPFGGSQEATVGRPIPPGAPSAAERELPE